MPGLDQPMGDTDTDPIWSETRQDFVVAGQLEVGEQFRTLTGDSATLTNIHPHRGRPERGFNLEVDGQHVYAVADNGLLVHNACPNALPPGASQTEAGQRAGEIRQWLNNLPEMMIARDRLEDLGVSSRGVLNPPQSIPNALREAGEHDMADNLIEAGSVGFERLARTLFRHW